MCFAGKAGIRMPNREDRSALYHKMILAANLYYKDKLSQQEIAQQLHISRPWVSKLLARAEEEGIVRIEVRSPGCGSDVLAEELKGKYRLAHAGVVAHRINAGDDPLACAAAAYFLSVLQPDDTVGVGWGTSVSRLIARTERRSLPQVQIIPLAGSFGNTISHVPNVSAMRLAEVLGASARTIHTPARCISRSEYDTLFANPSTRAILSQAEHAGILLVGIGAFEDSISPQYGIFSPGEIEALRQKDAIGDVALQYLNSAGQPIDTEATKRLIKADLLKASANARLSIGIAAGLRKVQTMDAALRLRLVNVLFTDDETALALLSL